MRDVSYFPAPPTSLSQADRERGDSTTPVPSSVAPALETTEPAGPLLAPLPLGFIVPTAAEAFESPPHEGCPLPAGALASGPGPVAEMADLHSSPVVVGAVTLPSSLARFEGGRKSTDLSKQVPTAPSEQEAVGHAAAGAVGVPRDAFAVAVAVGTAGAPEPTSTFPCHPSSVAVAPELVGDIVVVAGGPRDDRAGGGFAGVTFLATSVSRGGVPTAAARSRLMLTLDMLEGFRCPCRPAPRNRVQQQRISA